MEANQLKERLKKEIEKTIDKNNFSHNLFTRHNLVQAGLSLRKPGEDREQLEINYLYSILLIIKTISKLNNLGADIYYKQYEIIGDSLTISYTVENKQSLVRDEITIYIPISDKSIPKSIFEELIFSYNLDIKTRNTLNIKTYSLVGDFKEFMEKCHKFILG